MTGMVGPFKTSPRTLLVVSRKQILYYTEKFWHRNVPMFWLMQKVLREFNNKFISGKQSHTTDNIIFLIYANIFQ